MASIRGVTQDIRAWDWLLQQPAGSAGPYPVSLRLVDLPIIRAVQKLEALDPDSGRLPPQAYTAALNGRWADGSGYQVRVKGDDKHGLPYGADGDILFALFKIADSLPDAERRELIATGEFRDPTVGMIARAMGRAMNGETSRRIRDALQRLAHVRIEMHVTHVAGEVGTALLKASNTSDATVTPQPLEPDGTLVPRPRKGVDTVGVLHLLDYAVSRSYGRRADGEDWISHLQINPVWLRELVGGWAAWISVERYVALRSPIAKRLYQLFAGESARGVRAPWSYTLGELQQRCGTVGIARRPAAVRDSVAEAADELIGADILSRMECEKTAHGRYAFSFYPGPQLEIAALLRGVGMLDARESRVHRILLRFFGLTREQADRVLAEHPSRVHDVLQYLLYVRETDHLRVKRSWSAYLLKLVDGGVNLAGDVRYQSWLARRRRLEPRAEVVALPLSDYTPLTLADLSGVERSLAAVPGSTIVEGLRLPVHDASRTVPVSAEAVTVWTLVRGRAAARYPHTHSAYVEDLAPYDLSGGILTCVSATEFTLRKLEAIGLGPICEELTQATHGAVSSVQVEIFSPERHQSPRS